MGRVKNKVAIITGAADGMGKAMALLFAKEGAKVLATDIQEEKLKQWVTQSQSDGLALDYMAHDVTDEQAWNKVIAKAVALFGAINILVNNAGVYPPGATTDTTSTADWQQILNINLTGPFLGSKLCLTHMRKAGGGSIVNISSIAGMVGGDRKSVV